LHVNTTLYLKLINMYIYIDIYHLKYNDNCQITTRKLWFCFDVVIYCQWCRNVIQLNELINIVVARRAQNLKG